jgi:hypothetical protein
MPSAPLPPMGAKSDPLAPRMLCRCRTSSPPPPPALPHGLRGDWARTAALDAQYCSRCVGLRGQPQPLPNGRIHARLPPTSSRTRPFTDELTPEAGADQLLVQGSRAVDRPGANRSEWTPAGARFCCPISFPPPAPYFTAARGEDGAVVLGVGDWLCLGSARLLAQTATPIRSRPLFTLNGGKPHSGRAPPVPGFRSSNRVGSTGTSWSPSTAPSTSPCRLSGSPPRRNSTAPPAVPVIDSVYSSPEGVCHRLE